MIIIPEVPGYARHATAFEKIKMPSGIAAAVP
jgi:hypothetical protein